MNTELEKNFRWMDDDQFKFEPRAHAPEPTVAPSRYHKQNRKGSEFQSVGLKKKPPTGTSK